MRELVPTNRLVGCYPDVYDCRASGPAIGARAGSVQGDRRALLSHGTTTATNAVLERDIARTVLVTTAGFRDVLVIGRQARPVLYDLTVVRPEPLVPSDLVVTVNERVASDGEVMAALDDREIARVVDTVARLQPESVAVSLLFSYANDEHERRLEQALSTQLTFR